MSNNTKLFNSFFNCFISMIFAWMIIEMICNQIALFLGWKIIFLLLLHCQFRSLVQNLNSNSNFWNKNSTFNEKWKKSSITSFLYKSIYLFHLLWTKIQKFTLLFKDITTWIKRDRFLMTLYVGFLHYENLFKKPTLTAFSKRFLVFVSNWKTVFVFFVSKKHMPDLCFWV